VKAQKPNKTFKAHTISQFKERNPYGSIDKDYYHSEIVININGKTFSRNGDYQTGDIKKFMANYCKAGKRIIRR